jgi:hypothetical protein
MTPIFITCLAGSGSSLVSRTFNACGMWDGNDETYYTEKYRGDNAQHDLLTGLMHVFGQEDRFDMKWRFRAMLPEYNQIDAEAPKSIESKIRLILNRYVWEAVRLEHESFGVKVDTVRKTTGGHGTGDKNVVLWHELNWLIKEIWGDRTVFVSTLRTPMSYIDRLDRDPRFISTKGDHLVRYCDGLKAWNLILAEGGVIIPYPHAFDDGTIKDYVKDAGLEWNDEVDTIYDGSRPTRTDPDQMDKFFDDFSLAEEVVDGYNSILARIGREDLCTIPTMR